MLPSYLSSGCHRDISYSKQEGRGVGTIRKRTKVPKVFGETGVPHCGKTRKSPE